MCDLAAGPKEAFGGPPAVLGWWRRPLRPPRPSDLAWTSALPTPAAASGEGGPCRKPAPSPRPSRALAAPVSSHSSPPHGGPGGTNSALCAPVFPSGPPSDSFPPIFPSGPPWGSFPRDPGCRVGAGPGVGGGVGRGRPSRKRGPHPGTKARSRGGAAGSSTRAGGTARPRGPGRAGVGRVGPSSERWSRAFAGAEGPPHLVGGPERPRSRARATEAPGPRGVEGSGTKPGPTGGWLTVPQLRARALGRFRAASLSEMEPEGGSRPPPSLVRFWGRPTVERGALCEANSLRFSLLSFLGPGVPWAAPWVARLGPLVLFRCWV